MPYFNIEFTARGYLQEYIPDVVFAGRDHPGQLREIEVVKDASCEAGARAVQLNFLKDLIFTSKKFWFIDSNDNKLSELSIGNKWKILFFWANYYVLKWLVRIPRAISNRIQ